MQMNPRVADLLASLYEGCPDAIALYDSSGRLVSCNPAALHLSGFDEAGIAATQAFHSALGGFVQHLETLLRADSGEDVPVEMYLFPAKHDGEIVGVFAQAHDMLALRAAEESLELNQQRFRSLFEYHPDGIMALKADGVISRVNVALEAATGFYGEQIIGKSWSDLIAPECREAASEAFRSSARGEAVEFDAYLLDRLGNRIDVQMKLVPLHASGRIDGAYAIAKNVAAQRSAERAIELQSDHIRQLYLVAAARGESMEKQIDDTLALGCRLFGFDYGYVTRLDGAASVVINSVGDASRVEAGTAFPKGVLPWKAHLTAKFTTGSRHFALVFANNDGRSNAIADADRDLMQLMSLFVAAALERAEREDHIEQLAFYDALTGLPNRVLFNDRIRQTMGAAKRYRRGFAVMYLDLDDFKAINDRFGHPAGDLVLKAVSDRLKETLRESDTVARFGGDEFVVLQPVVNGAADASELARKIVAAMQHPMRIEDFEHVVHTSIGIALYPQDGKTAAELMDHADRALYHAKRSGRNQWQFYSSSEMT